MKIGELTLNRNWIPVVNATLKAQLDTAMKEADTKVKDLEKRVALLEKEEKEQKAKTERLKREKVSHLKTRISCFSCRTQLDD